MDMKNMIWLTRHVLFLLTHRLSRVTLSRLTALVPELHGMMPCRAISFLQCLQTTPLNKVLIFIWPQVSIKLEHLPLILYLLALE